MSTEPSKNRRRDYEIPCRLLAETTFDLSEALTPDQRAATPVGGLARDEVAQEAANFDFQSDNNTKEEETMAQHQSLETFYEDCEEQLGLGRRGVVDELLTRLDVWTLIWVAIFELGKRSLRLLIDDIFGRKNLTADEVYEIAQHIEKHLHTLNERFEQQENALAELKQTLAISNRDELVREVVANLVERGWKPDKAEKGIHGVLDALSRDEE